MAQKKQRILSGSSLIFKLRPRLDESGQSLIILAFAFVGLIAMLGLALDLGLVYVNRVGLKRAVDAATLAGVKELPSEEEAIARSMDFLIHNGYTDANVYVAGCVRDIHDDDGGGTDILINPPAKNDFRDDLLADDGQALNIETISTDPNLYYHYVRSTDPNAPTFFIDTRSYQVREFDVAGNDTGANTQCDAGNPVSNGGPFGSAGKIKLLGQVPVRMNFMQFFGFGEIVVQDEAVAQNASNLDVAVVMDVTGSMEFDTICFDCWKRCDETGTGCPAEDKYKDYPLNGRAFPLDFELLKETYVCGNGGDCTTSPYITPGQPKPKNGTDKYIILEAELYSVNTSVWDPGFRSAGQGYWALQRNGSSATTIATETQPAYVRHHPYLQKSDSNQPFGRRYLITDAQSGAAPRLEYDFYPTWGGEATYIHIRKQTFQEGRNDNPDDALYWAIDNGSIQESSGVATDWSNRESSDDAWQWITLTAADSLPGDLSGSKHKLKIWAGSPGYAIDRIVIAGGAALNTIAEIEAAGIDTEDATPGFAQRMAADLCNPIYGLSVVATDCRPDGYALQSTSVNNLNDPLFGDVQPLRGSKEAIKAFANRLDPSLDQIGFVKFDTSATQSAQLECLQAAAARDDAPGGAIANYPLDAAILGEFDETECSNPDLAAAGDPIEFQNVLIGIEDADAGGNTDIADGLRRGLHMLGINTDDDDSGNHANDCVWAQAGGTWTIGGEEQPREDITSHCSRGAAATQVIVLLTDGAPTDGSPGDNDECKANPIDPKPYPEFNDGDNKYRCIMYYAQIAGNNGIIIYTIGLGAGADPDLLRAVADETNGQYYFAPSAAQLNIIFNQILANIYVRLIQ